MHTFTPLHLMLLLHYHVTPDPWPQRGAPAVLEFTGDLIGLGLVEHVIKGKHGHQYGTTDRGAAYVDALCSVPLPVQRWAIPAQAERTLV